MQTTSYTVQSGDTLSAIAARFGTTHSGAGSVEQHHGSHRRSTPARRCEVPAGAAPVAPARCRRHAVYTVQRGDTVLSIARRFGVSANALMTANGLANPNLIRVGQQLRIPRRPPAAGKLERPIAENMSKIYFGDNLPILRELAGATDRPDLYRPAVQHRQATDAHAVKTVRSETGDRTGFQGQRYATREIGSKSYADIFDDYLGLSGAAPGRATPAAGAARHALFPYRLPGGHYCKVLLDTIFGARCFLNEIIWAYDYGGRPEAQMAAQARQHPRVRERPPSYLFNVDAIDRIPYMAPGLVGPEKAARGKLPTDTWWHTIVPTNGPRAHRLSHPETSRHPQTHRGRILAAGRHRPGLLCGQRDNRRGLPGAGAPFHPYRRQPGGFVRHGAPLCRRGRHRVDRPRRGSY